MSNTAMLNPSPSQFSLTEEKYRADKDIAGALADRLWGSVSPVRQRESRAVKAIIERNTELTAELEHCREHMASNATATKIKVLHDEVDELMAEAQAFDDKIIAVNDELIAAKSRIKDLENTEQEFKRLAEVLNERSLVSQQLASLRPEHLNTLRLLASVRIVAEGDLPDAYINDLFEDGYVARTKAAGYTFYSLTEAGEKVCLYSAKLAILVDH